MLLENLKSYLMGALALIGFVGVVLAWMLTLAITPWWVQVALLVTIGGALALRAWRRTENRVKRAEMEIERLRSRVTHLEGRATDLEKQVLELSDQVYLGVP
jgi:membrane protein implicated in regulation of membrane protease activity